MNDLPAIGSVIRERRNELGLSQERLAHLAGVSRQTLSGLERGTLNDLGYNRVAHILNVLGLDSPAPKSKTREQRMGLWMAAKSASVSYKHELDADTLATALVTGQVPDRYVANVAHFLDETPLPVLVMAIEDSARAGHVLPRRVWDNVSRLAREFGSSRARQLA